jgi:hypothetical protein
LDAPTFESVCAELARQRGATPGFQTIVELVNKSARKAEWRTAKQIRSQFSQIVVWLKKQRRNFFFNFINVFNVYLLKIIFI